MGWIWLLNDEQDSGDTYYIELVVEVDSVLEFDVEL